MCGLQTRLPAHANPQNLIFGSAVFGSQKFADADWRGCCFLTTILFSDKRLGTFETVINFDFLFAKATTEPLHAVILLVTEYWVLAVSTPSYPLLHGHYTLQTQTGSGSDIVYYCGCSCRSLVKNLWTGAGSELWDCAPLVEMLPFTRVTDSTVFRQSSVKVQRSQGSTEI